VKQGLLGWNTGKCVGQVGELERKRKEEDSLAAEVFGCFRACVVREVLQCFVVQASAQAHGDRVHKPAAKNIKCPVPTYVMPPDIRTRGALYAGLLSFWLRGASCMCRSSETTAPSEGRVVCKAMMPRGRASIARVRRCRE
jgi:hypothetical protein